MQWGDPCPDVAAPSLPPSWWAPCSLPCHWGTSHCDSACLTSRDRNVISSGPLGWGSLVRAVAGKGL